MKAVLMSIKPKWCEKIARGEKTVEVRKTKPKLQTPFKCYIYMTATKERCRFFEYITAYENSKGEIVNGAKKVVGEFVCDNIEKIACYVVADKYDEYLVSDKFLYDCGLSYEELHEYLDGEDGYAWKISKLKIYDSPKELCEFRNLQGQIIKRPFQSWGYVCTNE